MASTSSSLPSKKMSGAATTTTPSAAATASLQLLLREDPALHSLTSSTDPSVAYEYAARLLQTTETSTSTTSASASATANAALQDVERKLALVESLTVKLSRTSPQAVAGPFLRWHGYSVDGTTAGTENLPAMTATEGSGGTTASSATTTTTLAAVRGRADRLVRQSQVLESVATRVESSLQRGVDRLSLACLRLERVLELSQTLKRLLRLQFEWTKVQNYDLDDLRDLSRAAASVAVLEDLLNQPEWSGSSGTEPLRALADLPPAARRTAAQVRQAAQTWWDKSTAATADGSDNTLSSLAATLQVYHSLHELPQAVWKAVEQAHDRAATASRVLATTTSTTGTTSSSNTDKKAIRRHSAETWATVVTQAALHVQQLQHVLTVKTDPVSRRRLYQVVADAPVPAAYHQTSDPSTNASRFDLFGLFWQRLSRTMGDAFRSSTITLDADLYPAVRGVAQSMVGRLLEHHQGPSSLLLTEVGGGGPSAPTGILGGQLPADFWGPYDASSLSSVDNPQAAPETWTRGESTTVTTGSASGVAVGGGGAATATTSNWAAVLSSSEWESFQGNAKTQAGLYRLQEAFLQACTQRLCQPLQYLFPEHVTLDEHGVPLSGGALSLLPSKYDIQRFDENIRQELTLADPREGGGGDATLVPLIAACVVDMMTQFGQRAQQALSGAHHKQYITVNGSAWTMNESLQHDRKVAVILYTISHYLRAAPDKTFVAPYRPAHLPAHEEAAALCTGSLQPALTTLDDTVRTHILSKVAQALNQNMSNLLAKVHSGVYLSDRPPSDDVDQSGTAFCQTQIAPALTAMANTILARFPPPYATYLACSVTSFCIYAFCSNLALLRPLGETARLHITQDLADLELALEQFITKTCTSTTLSGLAKGKPYGELRSVRQMLYWNGLSSKNKTGTDLAKALLREGWIRHVRPSTALHYLFSYAPTLLTSPHHAQRVKAETYAQRLVLWDGTPDGDAEETAWMNTLASCDAYQQRQAAAARGSADGDTRIAECLMALGPELLRRRRS